MRLAVPTAGRHGVDLASNGELPVEELPSPGQSRANRTV